MAEGVNILILSDRGVDRENAPIPALLAVAGLHHHLIREGSRTQVGLVLESGEPREVHHFATLLGYGASAINPYLAYDTLAAMITDGLLTEIEYDQAEYRYTKAAVKGVVKIVIQDGHLHHPELPRRPDLRGGRAEPGADRPVLHRHPLPGERHRAWRRSPRKC